MTKKTPIKIIKRAERDRSEDATKQAKPVRKTAQETARDMVSTVTNWVNELQQKRRIDKSLAIQTLFPDPPRPNEA
ncbi:MAG: hypothetical protein QOJ64_3850 [Acidobacteriota bacterium]|jgi:hypothetical protein|nr:hypothetical protein [Acidobacteriota bacterium]